jgi:heat shock protein HslJ
MRRLVIAAALTLLAGCATALRPDSSVPLAGEWEIAAVDGEPTGGGEAFVLSLKPPNGWAAFGCNAGSGSVRIERGWLVTGDWIVTAALCPPEERMRFERRGFEILGAPAAIERSGGAVHLRNERGSIELRPLAPVRLAGMKWTVPDVNGNAPPAGAAIEFEEQEFEGYFGCNWIGGVYRQEANIFSLGISRDTERGCDDGIMAFEEQGFFVMRGGDALIERVRPRVIRLSNRRGWLLLEPAR